MTSGARRHVPTRLVVALVAALLTGGCGSSDEPSRASATIPPAASSSQYTTPQTSATAGLAPTTTAEQAPTTAVPGSTTAAASSASASADAQQGAPKQAAAREGTRDAASLPRSGVGGAKLGTVVVKRRSVVTLGGTDPRGQTLDDASHALTLTTIGNGGGSVVQPGTYSSVTIKTRRRWTLRFEPLPGD